MTSFFGARGEKKSEILLMMMKRGLKKKGYLYDLLRSQSQKSQKGVEFSHAPPLRPRRVPLSADS